MEKTTSTRLPLHGLETADGHYFHHTAPFRLNEEEIEALLEHGIAYSTQFFNEAEDALLRRNWEHFAKKNNIPVEEAPRAVKVRQQREGIFRDVDFTNFWPTLCKGLPHRSAFQIMTRIARIYDPAVLSGKDKILYGTTSREVMLTDEDLEEIDKMLARGLSWTIISQHIGRTTKRCQRQYNRWIESKEHITRRLWMKLWRNVDALPDFEDDEDVTDSPILQKIRSFCFSDDSVMLEQIIEELDISSQAKDLEKSEEAIRNTWRIILKKLRKFVRQEKKKPYPSPDDLIFIRAVNENIKFAFLATFDQHMNFLKLLIDQTPDDHVYSSFKMNLYDVPKIESNMKRQGIAHFYSGNVSEFLYLYKTVYSILFRCDKFVFSRLNLKYSIKERLMILLNTYELQWNYLFKDRDRNSAKRVDMDKYSEKHHFCKDKYLFVNTRFFLDALVEFTVDKHPDWIPPTKLRRYMVRSETKSLFAEGVDNSSLVNAEDFTVYADYKSSRNPSKSLVVKQKHIPPSMQYANSGWSAEDNSNVQYLSKRDKKSKLRYGLVKDES